ncbi:serine/threonine-protein kinase [Amycolatopsis carbonis]|uniref:non-specific serine/threonine protein kinase n=1 Tax=Amycolatopsis carbonis TaxID=715471 RepID=A0A9Y2MVF3_9PSEU|nr:serine/threonine-protein kinase [Amycolatopsis sp. 2-15]WIX82840.1 serine/threonine-protein kinase [Amycolatopsis sp. 2-15]
MTVGRYEVQHLIGSGGTARVYRAFDRRLGRPVALKVYDRDVVAADQVRRLREKTIQAGIDHPGVVAVLDSGTDHSRPFLVMQLVDGGNLAERLLAGPLPAAEVSGLGVRLTESLAHLHNRRVVHRDLKPANILLGPDGPLIGDFGIAHELGSTHITGTGFVTGTAAYLAPEQITGEPAGPAADVYALGLILLECLTAEREYPGTMAESALARLHRSPRIPDGLPGPLAHTLTRMTAREPEHRPTAHEALQMLRQPTTTHTGTAVTGQARVPGSTRRRRTPIALSGLAATAAAAAVVVALTSPDAPRPSTPAAEAPTMTVPAPSATPVQIIPAPSPATSAKSPATAIAGPPAPPGPASLPGPGALTANRDDKAANPADKAKGKPKDKGKGHTHP